MLIIANGMLRSGSTLQYNVAASILESRGPLARVGYMGEFSSPDARVKLDTMKADEGWSIIKTHEAPLEPAFYDDRVRVLFSYRDVRDIAASIKKKWAYPFEQILSDIEKMIEIEQAFARVPNVLVQSYDKLYNELPEAVQEIAQFLDVRLCHEDVARISDALSVESLSQRIKAQAKRPMTRLLSRVAGRFRIDPKTQLHDNHISASGGRNGDWVNQFDQAEIATIEERFHSWLRDRQYV